MNIMNIILEAVNIPKYFPLRFLFFFWMFLWYTYTRSYQTGKEILCYKNYIFFSGKKPFCQLQWSLHFFLCADILRITKQKKYAYFSFHECRNEAVIANTIHNTKWCSFFLDVSVIYLYAVVSDRKGNIMLHKLYVFFRKETILSIAVILALLSMFWVRPDKAYFTYIDFRTSLLWHIDKGSADFRLVWACFRD